MSVGTSTSPDAAVGPSVPPARPARRHRRMGRVSRWLGPLMTFLPFVGVWYFVSKVLLADDLRFLLPVPDEVVRESFLDPYNRVELLRALGLSTKVAMAGLAIAIVLGMAVAVAMSQALWVENSLYPYAGWTGSA